jgi:hypothetical protein
MALTPQSFSRTPARSRYSARVAPPRNHLSAEIEVLDFRGFVLSVLSRHQR